MSGSVIEAGPVIEAASRRAADAAADVDGGTAPSLAETLAGYGSLGALGLGVERADDDVSDAAELLAAVAGECMSTAFSLWAQRMVTEYVRASSLPGREALLSDLVSGRLAGSIAMATALQESAGLGTVPTVAVPDGEGGYRVSGRIAWASNIAPGTLVILPARVDDERVLVAVRVGADGFTTRPVEGLLALDATRSAMLLLDDVHVSADAVLATSLQAAAEQRATHYLLQAALCLGLARRALVEAAARLDGANGVLAGFQRRLEDEYQQLSGELRLAASAVSATDPHAVTRLRFDAARLAQASTGQEAALTGGRGYLTASATNRRLREAAFLPVQSPSEVQLLCELEQFGDHPADYYSI
jgi:alkylation response protein AidB-like acyl-CoA dehydrogenase